MIDIGDRERGTRPLLMGWLRQVKSSQRRCSIHPTNVLRSGTYLLRCRLITEPETNRIQHACSGLHNVRTLEEYSRVRC